MTSDEYLESRLEDQIAWYDAKSKSNKQGFMVLRTIEVVAAATIPLLIGYVTEHPGLGIIAGIFGVVVAVIAGLLSILKVQENWIEYRSVSESLKHEKFLYLTKSMPYNRAENLTLLVSRVEGLISKENSNWANYSMAAGKKEDIEQYTLEKKRR